MLGGLLLLLRRLWLTPLEPFQPLQATREHSTPPDSPVSRPHDATQSCAAECKNLSLSKARGNRRCKGLQTSRRLQLDNLSTWQLCATGTTERGPTKLAQPAQWLDI